MLAELAAANAAFAVIKQTLANGRELADAGKAISDFVSNKEKIRELGTKKKNSFWRKVGGNAGDDLEEFMALEKLNKQEEELKQAMIYYGRPGLWGDWIKFQAEARKRRLQEKEEAERKRKQIIEYTIATVCLFFGAFVLLAILWLVFRGGQNV